MSAFNEISENLLKAKRDIVSNRASIVEISSAMVNNSQITEIDFSKIDKEDLINMRDTLFEIVTNEDDDGYILLDPNHSFTRLTSIQYKIHALEAAPKQRVPSSFRFL